MKRKLFNATALYGAMLLLLAASAFTACTKDYDDELRIQREIIENNEKELRETIDYYQTEVNNLIAQLKLAYENADAQQQIEIDAAKAKLTELASALKTAEANISNLAANYEAFKVAVEADFNLLKQDIKAIGIRIDGIDNRLADVEAAMAAIEEFRRSAEEKLEQLKKSQEASQEDIAALESDMQEVWYAINDLFSYYNSLRDDLLAQDKNLRDTINGVDTNLRDKIDALSADLGLQITNMNTTLTSQISDILILVHTMGDKTQEKIDAVKVELNVLIENTRIELTEALNEYKIEVNLKFEQIDSLIDDLNGSIMNFAERLDTVEADIAALKGRIQGIRWIPSYWDAMLPLYTTFTFSGVYTSAQVMEEVYVVCNDPNIIQKITEASGSPYKVEVVANEVSPVPTRAIKENVFRISKVEAGSTANALKVTVDFLPLGDMDDHCFITYDVNGEVDKIVMKYRIAIKITDGKGNIALGDFIQVFLQPKV